MTSPTTLRRPQERDLKGEGKHDAALTAHRTLRNPKPKLRSWAGDLVT
jgi:hypothetical protein